MRVARHLGHARRRRHRQARGVALDHGGDPRPHAQVVVVAVEDDAVGGVALRVELGERTQRRGAQRGGHAQLVALLVRRVTDPDRRRPTAAPPAPPSRVRRA